VDAHIFTKQSEKLTSACQKADDKSFMAQEMDADGGIHAVRNYNDVRSV
jgi:hypothetical protein